MADRTVDILIAIDSRLKALEETQKGLAKIKEEGKKADQALQQTRKELEKTKEESDSFGKSLKEGFGIDVAHRAVEMLTNVTRLLQAAVMDGIRFNATVESAGLGVAAVLKQFDQSGKYKTFADAMKASAGAIEILKEKAKESPATFEQLVGAYQGLSGSFASAGLQMKQQIDLVVLMSQALAGLGIRSEQILQESRALVTGNITEDAMAARILGITKADVDQARNAGQLYEFLTKKLGAFSEAGTEGAKSWNTQLSNLEDNLTQLKGLVASGIFEPMKEVIASINQLLGTRDASATASGLGAMLAAEFDGVLGVIDHVDAAFRSKGLTIANVLGTVTGTKALWNAGLGAAFTGGRVNSIGDDLEKERNALLEQVKLATSIKDKEEARKQIKEAILATQDSIYQSEGDERDILQLHLGLLENLEARFERYAGTKAAEDQRAAQNAAQHKKDHEIIIDKLQEEIELAKAKASGDAELVRHLEEQQLLQRTISELEKAGGKNLQMRVAAATQLVEQLRAVANLEAKQRNAQIIEATEKVSTAPSKEGARLQKKVDELRAKAIEQTVADAGITTLPATASGADISQAISSKDLGEELGINSSRYTKAYEAARALADAERELAQWESQKNDQLATYERRQRRVVEDAGDLLDKKTSEAEKQDLINVKVEELRKNTELLGTSEAELRSLATKEVENELKKKQLLEEQRDARKDGVRALKEERDLLESIRRRMDVIEHDPFMPRGQKDNALKPLLNEERGALLGLQGKGEDVGPDLERNRQRSKGTTLAGGLESGWVRALDDIGTASENTADLVTSSLGTAIDGISQGLKGLILGTTTWGQVGIQALQALTQELVNYGVKIVAHYALVGAQQLASHVLGQSLQQTATQTSTQSATQVATAWAPAAGTVNAATYGSSASTGLVATLATIAAVVAAVAALSGGFAEGGYTGSGGKYEPAGIVHRGEYVLNQRATNHYGPAMLDRMNRMDMPMPGYAEGGLVATPIAPAQGGGSAGGRPVQVHVVFDESDMRKKILNHPEAEHQIIRTGRRRAAEMGVRG